MPCPRSARLLPAPRRRDMRASATERRRSHARSERAARPAGARALRGEARLIRASPIRRGKAGGRPLRDRRRLLGQLRDQHDERRAARFVLSRGCDACGCGLAVGRSRDPPKGSAVACQTQVGCRNGKPTGHPPRPAFSLRLGSRGHLSSWRRLVPCTLRVQRGSKNLWEPDLN